MLKLIIEWSYLANGSHARIIAISLATCRYETSVSSSPTCYFKCDVWNSIWDVFQLFSYAIVNGRILHCQKIILFRITKMFVGAYNWYATELIYNDLIYLVNIRRLNTLLVWGVSMKLFVFIRSEIYVLEPERSRVLQL